MCGAFYCQGEEGRGAIIEEVSATVQAVGHDDRAQGVAMEVGSGEVQSLTF